MENRVLVTGGTGLIGRALVKLLSEQGKEVSVISLDRITDQDFLKQVKEIKYVDLRDFNSCLVEIKKFREIYHLAGIKGSPKLTSQKPASFFVNTMQFNLNVMEAAFRADVDKFLYTSSVGVYAPAEIFKEDSVWETFPSPNDRFAGWAKRMGELQAEAYKIEYGWNAVRIVRPANVYGPFDNFDSNTAMVIPSLISRILQGENPLRVWGDGKSIRDFIYSEDVARAMLTVMNSNDTQPFNIGSGIGVSIRELIEIFCTIFPGLNVEWDENGPKGDDVRLMDTTRLTALGFRPQVSIDEGINRTVAWFKERGVNLDNSRYNAFSEKRKE